MWSILLLLTLTLAIYSYSCIAFELQSSKQYSNSNSNSNSNSKSNSKSNRNSRFGTNLNSNFKFKSSQVLSGWSDGDVLTRGLKASLSAMVLSSIVLTAPGVAVAKEGMPSLEKCFNAVEKEVDDTRGENIKRLKDDISKGDWTDVKLWSREYEAGFRGGCLKMAWKQMEGEEQKRGIEITNSFTFDLIALNKAARIEDAPEANKRVDQVKADLKEFLTLRHQ